MTCNVTGNLTKNFGLAEIACNDAAHTLHLTPQLVDHAQRLQRFRDWFNRPMQVNSWFRTPEYNKKIGGVEDSQHTLGIATDIALPDEYFKMDKKRQQEFLENIKLKWQIMCQTDGVRGGLGWYASFVHFDSRPGTGGMAFWDLRR